MAKKFIKKIMPNHETIRDHKYLKVFGSLLHDPNLWHLNRRSVSAAFAVGLFFAWVPVPFQMILATAAAIIFRVNLPLSVVLVWVTNPLTMGPMFYGAFELGTFILNDTTSVWPVFELSWVWVETALLLIWKPFLLGCLILGTISSIAGYIVIRLLWRWQIVREWKQRKLKRKIKN